MKKSQIEERGSYLRDSIFAANDGVITTFAVVAGATGASLSSNVVVILGFANLFADSISMATGDYLGSKSEIEYEKAKNALMHKHAPPLNQAIVTFISFNLVGIIPLIPYLLAIPFKFETSVISVAFTLFIIGALRSALTRKSWIRSGLEMLFVGGIAASVAYFIGFLLEKYII